MAVDKREAAGAIVITGRTIHDFPYGGLARIVAQHAHDEFTVVDAVFAFVKEQPGLRRARRPHIARFPIDESPGWSPGRVFHIGTVKPGIHGNAADARHGSSRVWSRG